LCSFSDPAKSKSVNIVTNNKSSWSEKVKFSGNPMVDFFRFEPAALQKATFTSLWECHLLVLRREFESAQSSFQCREVADCVQLLQSTELLAAGES